MVSLHLVYGLKKAWPSIEFALVELGKSFIHSSAYLLGFLYLVLPPLEVEVSKNAIFEAWISSTS